METVESAEEARMGINELGVKPWIAHEQSHIKGYMKAVRLPQIKKAISKEKLTKRGLVSPLEYYLRQHTLLKVRGITRCTQMRIAHNRPAELSGRAVFVENHHLV